MSSILALCLVLMAESPSLTSEWLSQFESSDRDVRARALDLLQHRLSRGETDPETIEGFLRAGFETDHVLRMRVYGMGRFLPWASVDPLIEALSDARPPAREQAARGLSFLGSVAGRAIEPLIPRLRDPDDMVRSMAAHAIARIDRDGRALPELLVMARSPDVQARRSACFALDLYGERAYPSWPDLLPLLDDEDEQVRYWLVIALGNVTDTEPDVLVVLAGLLDEDPSAYVRERVAWEFWEVASGRRSLPPEAVAALVGALERDPSDVVRLRAAKALARKRKLRRQHRHVFKRCVETSTGELRDVCRKAS